MALLRKQVEDTIRDDVLVTASEGINFNALKPESFH